MRKRKRYYRKIFLIQILVTVFGLGFFLSVEEAWAGTYYVATGGNDSEGNGTEVSPWATFNYAISKTSFGDTVIAKPGVYNQSVLIRDKDGITLKGTLGANGERLSIIDPYVDVGGQWVKDKPGDPNDKIYKKYVGWKSWAYVVEIDGKKYKIWRICQVDNDYAEEARCTKAEMDYKTILNMKNTDDYPVTGEGGLYGYLSFWDGLGMLGTVTKDGWAYFSEQDGKNINEYKILFATKPQYGDGAITIFSSDSVKIKDLEIRATKFGVYNIKYGGSHPDLNYPSNLVIDNNKILYGDTKIRLYGNNHSITNNELTDYSYAGDYLKDNGGDIHGSWNTETDTGLLRLWIHKAIRYVLNNEAGGISSNGMTINGNNIVASGNKAHNMFQGIMADGGDHKIFDNDIRNMTQICWVGGKLGRVSIYDNIFYNCNSLMRVMEWDQCLKENDACIGGGKNYADIKIYNNKLWQEPNTGSFIKVHYNKYLPTGNINPIGKVWIYHNSFSGGYDLFNIGSYFGYWRPHGGTGNINLANNIFSAGINQQWSGSDCLTGQCTANLGQCSSNWAKEMPSCNSRNNNILSEKLMWDTAQPHDFRIPAEYENAIRGKGIHVVNVLGLPWESAVPYPEGAVDIGYVHGDPQSQAADVNFDGTVNSQDITLCVNVILEIVTDPPIDPVFVARAKAVVPDIQVCDSLDLTAIVIEILK